MAYLQLPELRYGAFTWLRLHIAPHLLWPCPGRDSGSLQMSRYLGRTGNFANDGSSMNGRTKRYWRAMSSVADEWGQH